MTARNVITMLAGLGFTIWSAIVFFNSMDGDVLWSQVVSGIGLLLFGMLFVIFLVRIVKSGNPQT